MHCADLPELLLGQRIVAHPALDPAARLALFRSCHALARLVLLHAPGSGKRVTHHVSGGASSDSDSDSSDGSDSDISNGSDNSIGDDALQWSPTLAHLLGSKWQPLPPPQLGLELRVESSVELFGTAPQPPLPLPPPTSITRHVSRLHLHQLRLTPPDLAAWQLHGPARWPHLQHLTLHDCQMRPGAGAQQLPPIARLLSFAWEPAQAPDVPAQESLEFHLNRADVPALTWLLERLPCLTRLRVDGLVESREALEALMRHPTLEHVEIGGLPNRLFGLSQRPCRWKTLTLWGGASLSNVANLPLAGLERLTITGFVGAWNDTRDAEDNARGVAALQQLHRGGKLVLAPSAYALVGVLRPWPLQPGEGMFYLGTTASHGLMSELLRLVLEAGRGVNVLEVDWEAPALPWLRDEAAPLLRQHAGKIHTLCFHVWNRTPESWCAGVLGALPACVTHVQVMVEGLSLGVRVRALVRGGVEELRHPLKLTILPWRGAICEELEAELRQLAAGGGGGEGQGQPGSLLTLEVV